MNALVRPSVNRPLVLFAVLGLVAACQSGIGTAGTLPPASGSPASPTSPASAAPSTPATNPSSPAESPSPVTSPTASTTPATPTTGPTAAASSGTPRASASQAPVQTTSFAVYLLSGGTLVAVHRQVPQTVAVARAAVTALLAGPTVAEAAAPGSLRTAVPSGVQLLGISLAGGVATVDLSSEFQAGGGSASMFGRLAQLTYTLTQFPTITGLLLRLDGQPVTVFSNEGIVLSGPIGRADYRSSLPAILVERPAWNDTLPNPARVSGLANVFEAAFIAEISTADGTLLARRNVMATCGTGCWGTFDVSIPYHLDRPQPGFVTVYDLSAQDGSRIDVRSYPVTLTPGG